MLFGSKNKLRRAGDFKVFCEGKAVQQVSHVKYLGVLLDCTLSGSAHVNNVVKTCMGRLAFLYRNSSLLDLHCRRTLCSSLIQPYIDYCSSSWYEGLSKALKSKLDVIQRKMARFALGLQPRDHVGLHEFRSLSWLSIPDRVKYFRLIHLFRIKHGLAPQYLRRNLASVSETHSHNTRGSVSNFHVSKSVSKTTSSFTYSCVKDWNLLPADLKSIESLSRFKSKLREFLLSSYG